jgi:hypothetical protein
LTLFLLRWVSHTLSLSSLLLLRPTLLLLDSSLLRLRRTLSVNLLLSLLLNVLSLLLTSSSLLLLSLLLRRTLSINLLPSLLLSGLSLLLNHRSLLLCCLPSSLSFISPYLLLELLGLLTRFSITTRCLSLKVSNSLPPRVSAPRGFTTAFVSYLKLLPLYFLRHSFKTQCSRQIPFEMRSLRRVADHYRCLIKFPGDARWQIDLAPAPG